MTPGSGAGGANAARTAPPSPRPGRRTSVVRIPLLVNPMAVADFTEVGRKGGRRLCVTEARRVGNDDVLETPARLMSMQG